MRYFSTFSGAGGFELGIEYAMDVSNSKRNKQERVGTQQSFTCVGFSEIDKYASAVLKYHYPNIKNYGDIKKIDWSEVPDFDLLVGGSPCQDLSVAGKRKGLSGERSGLFAEFVRALQEKKPKHFVWENVKGALSSNQGWDFTEVQAQMAEAGYFLWWQVLNAKDFGVPQNRERVFVIGTRGEGGREVFFERGGDTKNLEEITQGVSDAQRIYDPEGIAKSQKALGGGLGAKTGLYAVRQPLRYLNRNQKNIEGDYAFCVDASQTSGVRTADRVRRLTPKECERLMSWPDNWTRWGILDDEKREMSDTQRYKMCGNGVVSEVVKHIVLSIL